MAFEIKEVLSSLAKQGIKVNEIKKEVTISKDQNYGLKVLGKLDFLEKIGYHVVKATFVRGKNKFADDDTKPKKKIDKQEKYQLKNKKK